MYDRASVKLFTNKSNILLYNICIWKSGKINNIEREFRGPSHKNQNIA